MIRFSNHRQLFKEDSRGKQITNKIQAARAGAG